MKKRAIRTDQRMLSAAVMEFSRKMMNKLWDKAEDGYVGWDDIAYLAPIMKRLESHVQRLLSGDYEQCVDIANLAMMIDGL